MSSAKFAAILAVLVPCVAFAQTGELISVPSDSLGHHWAVEGKRTSRDVVEILTRRDGASVTVFSLRQIDCAARTFHTLGLGDTLEEAKSNNVEPSPPNPLQEGSIAASVSDYACAKFR
jgi:hypothetical protein